MSIEELEAIEERARVEESVVLAALARVPPSWNMEQRLPAGGFFRRGSIQVMYTVQRYDDGRIWIHVSAGACQYRDRYWFVASGAGSRSRPGLRQEVQVENGDGPSMCSGGGSAGRERRERSTDRACHVGPDARWEQGDDQPSGGGEDGPLAPVFGARLEGGEGERGDDGAEQPAVQRSGVLDLERPARLGWGEGWTEAEVSGPRGFTAAVANLPDGTQFIECPDHKFRRLPPPRVRWLGNGLPARVARLRAFGNSIYPPVAAEVIRAYMDVCAQTDPA